MWGSLNMLFQFIAWNHNENRMLHDSKILFLLKIMYGNAMKKIFGHKNGAIEYSWMSTWFKKNEKNWKILQKCFQVMKYQNYEFYETQLFSLTLMSDWSIWSYLNKISFDFNFRKFRFFQSFESSSILNLNRWYRNVFSGWHFVNGFWRFHTA